MKCYLVAFALGFWATTGMSEPVPEPFTVTAKIGTTPMGGADGVAIWHNKLDASKSTVIGANPRSGLGVFALDGAVIQKIDFAKGGAGEVDVRYDILLNNEKVSLVAGGMNAQRGVFVYKVEPATGKLIDVLSKPVTTTVRPYGSCMYKSRATGNVYVFITSKQGTVEQYVLLPQTNGTVEVSLVRTIQHTEGENVVLEACVADDDTGLLYLAQEEECKIWCYNAEPTGDDTHTLVDHALIKAGDNVEGLAIYPSSETEGYLLVSIQGSWTYKVYTRTSPHKLLGSFQIKLPTQDGIVQAHDCIEVNKAAMGPAFPEGLFVTQNANNAAGSHFQLVSWGDLAAALTQPLPTAP